MIRQQVEQRCEDPLLFDVIPTVRLVSVDGRKNVQIECCECGETFQQQRRIWLKAAWPEACPSCRKAATKHDPIKCNGCGVQIWRGSTNCKSCAQRLPRPNCLDCGVQIGRQAERCRACHNKKQNRGLSRERTLFQNSDAWKAVRKQCFERDGYSCVQCGVEGGYLEAHHIIHWSRSVERRLDLSNLATLCRPCHMFVHWGAKTNA